MTGSLNASIAQWLIASGKATAPYTASQGTVLGRRGRVHVSADADGAVWIGGGTHTLISGSVLLLNSTSPNPLVRTDRRLPPECQGGDLECPV